MIKATNLLKSYNNGKNQVLKDISIEIENGSFTVITGASGSGKSTLMSILSGLEKADSGNVFYDDLEISKMTEKELTTFRREKVGFIFQQYYLLPHLNVEKNVMLGADLVGNKEFKKIIEKVGLENKVKQKPSELSGGEQQRVCIARALAKKPQFLFLDEPTGALDEETGRNVLDYIIKLKNQERFTMIMVTHNLNICEMADTIITMNSGKIVSIKKNEQVKSAYEIGW